MRIAVVEWWPRICGATDWAIHLSHAKPPRGVTCERVSFSKSGRHLAAWGRGNLWQVHRQADAVDVLNQYDLVITSDVVCFAPALVDRGRSVPYYVDVLRQMKTPWTSMYHGGTYPSKYDDTLRAVFETKSFTGRLITTRLPEARARLDHITPRPIAYANYPYLPYSLEFRQPPSKLPPVSRRKRGAILMTARIAVNKGQNVAMYLGPKAGVNVRLYGYNAFGLPSIGWRLVELADALRYRVVKKPQLPKDKAHLTHPRAVRFYTGAFTVSHNGYETSYHDAYLSLDEIDWGAAAVHLSLPSEDFRGTLEYVTLDAIAAGAVAIVPEHNVDYPRYTRDAFPSVPFSRASIWARKDGTAAVKINPDEERAIVTALDYYANRATRVELERIAAAQHRELVTKHDPGTVLRKLLKHTEGAI